jgi:Transposase IS116/IS110/IS902 family
LQKVMDVVQEHIKVLEKAMLNLVKELMPELLEVKGIGVVLAATLLAEASAVRRFRNQHSFAMLAGSAPVARSSGACQRRQLNLGGNRRLNRTFHMLALIRLRLDDATKDYLTKNKAEGKTKRAVLRCLKPISRVLSSVSCTPPCTSTLNAGSPLDNPRPSSSGSDFAARSVKEDCFADAATMRLLDRCYSLH